MCDTQVIIQAKHQQMFIVKVWMSIIEIHLVGFIDGTLTNINLPHIILTALNWILMCCKTWS